jgi:uncharacterized protein YbbC (DUF1343 family)/beta-glucosidase-like glycosyl hydrolase
MSRLLKGLVILLFFFNKNIFAAGAGQYFIMTLPNFTKESEYFTWLSKIRPAGVMLASNNFENCEQIKKLCSLLQSQAKKLGIYPLIISIDWEGGIISRPSEAAGFTSVPSPYNLAQAGRACCFLAGKLIGQQLWLAGVNIDFAPGVDLFDKDNQVLATRCFSQDPEITSEYGLSFAKGLLSENIIPVFKHYPGLGSGKNDTHFSSVVINSNQKDFDKNERPFLEVLKSKMPIIMVSHAKLNRFGKIPASRSAQVVQHLKRQNPDLVLITDDISMQAYHDGMALCQAAMQSINNGFDFLIYFAPSRKQVELIEKLNRLLDAKESLARQKINKLILKKYIPKHILKTKKVGNYLAKRALGKRISPIVGHKSCTLISVDLPKIRIADGWFIDSGGSVTKKLLEKENVKVEEFILDAKDNQSVGKLKKILADHKSNHIVLQSFFYGDGSWNQTQKQWLELLKPYQDKLIIFSLGHPLESKFLPKSQVIEIGSFHIPVIKQAVKRLTRAGLVTGADKLAQNLNLITNKRVGLLCHKCSLVQDQFLPDFLKSKNASLCAIFAPEHGILGNNQAGQKITSQQNTNWGCPVYSLYGETRCPTKDMLKNLDLLIIDLQEVGVRCYTYLSTLKLTLEGAAKSKIPVLLLERPNPIKFLGVQGPVLNRKLESFVGKIDSKFIHGQTIGQLAKDLNKKIGADLKILYCRGDTKSIDRYFYSNFIPPSPNLVNIDSIYDYPCTVFIEGTNYSEGRGTMHPFEQIGAPWVDAEKLAAKLNAKNLCGVYFEPVSFIPKNISDMAENPKHLGKLCNGVYLHVYNHRSIKPYLIAKTILKELFTLYPKQSTWIKSGGRYFVDLLAGDDSFRREI